METWNLKHLPKWQADRILKNSGNILLAFMIPVIVYYFEMINDFSLIMLMNSWSVKAILESER